MFASFKDTVKKESFNKIPKEVLAAYNAQIPENIRAQYIDTNDGRCVLTPDVDDPNMHVMFTVPDVQLLDKIPEDIKTQEELADYMYRTQKSLHYRVDGKPYMNINGLKVRFEDFIKSPYDHFELKNGGSLYITPQKFPDLKPLPLVAGGTKIELKIKRIPDERKNIIVLQSDENYWLQLILELSLINGEKSTIKMFCRFQKCKTVKELLCAFKISDALARGNYSMPLMDCPIPLPLKNPISPDIRKFWEEAADVESVLNVQFNPSVTSYQRDIYLIQELYKGLVLKQPFSLELKEREQTGLHSSGKEDFETNIGKKMAIAYVEKHQWNVLGAAFETIDFCCIFDAIISEVAEDNVYNDKPYFIHLSPAEGKTMRLVRYITTSEEKISEFQDQFEDHNALLQYLSKAESISK